MAQPIMPLCFSFYINITISSHYISFDASPIRTRPHAILMGCGPVWRGGLSFFPCFLFSVSVFILFFFVLFYFPFSLCFTFILVYFFLFFFNEKFIISDVSIDKGAS
jgi:hypothetical protein